MTEILDELKERIETMEKLIGNQNFKVVEAYNFLNWSHKIYQSLEDMEISRDKWKTKYLELKRKDKK